MPIQDLLQAVVEEINGEQWSMPITAAREYRPRYDVRDMSTLRVSVVPKAVTLESGTRGADKREYQVDLAVQRRLSEESEEEIDALVGVVEDIASHFRMRRPAILPSMVCVRVDIDPIYAVEHLDELMIFTSVVTLTFTTLGG